MDSVQHVGLMQARSEAFGFTVAREPFAGKPGTSPKPHDSSMSASGVDDVDALHEQHRTPAQKDLQGPASWTSDQDHEPHASLPFQTGEYALRKSK